MALATAEPRTAVVGRNQWDEHEIGLYDRVALGRLHNAERAGLERIAGKEAEGLRPYDTTLTVNPANGSFDIMLLPGSHTLIGSAESGTGYATIRVGDADLENLTIVTAPAFKLRGRIAVEGRTVSAADLERLRISLRRDPPPAEAPSAITSNYSNPLPDGSFTLEAHSGNYRVNVAPLLTVAPDLFALPLPPGLQRAYVKSIGLGNADVLNAGLQLGQPAEAVLDVVIGTNPGTISGSVVDDRLGPVRDASVVILPDLRQRTDLYRAVTTDLSGRFEIDRVPPGDYKIFAWADVDHDAWFDQDFMRDYDNRGSLLVIHARYHCTGDPVVDAVAARIRLRVHRLLRIIDDE